MPVSPQIRRLAVWWLAVNSAGVAISIFIERYIFYQGVKAGWFNRPSGDHEVIYISVWLVGEILLGALQVLTCCWLISLVTARSKIFLVGLGVTLGIVTAILFTLLPMFVVNSVMFAEPVTGIYALLLSGIVFGAIAGRSQWQAVIQK